jgi:hypothetical protein
MVSSKIKKSLLNLNKVLSRQKYDEHWMAIETQTAEKKVAGICQKKT